MVILAKLLNVADVGRFSLAMAICTPISVFFALRLSEVQITDTENIYRFGHYLSVQIVMSLIAVLTISTIVLFSNFNAQDSILIIAVGIGQAIILNRDVFISFNQKHERMDTVAFSKIILGVGSLSTLGLVLWSTRQLVWGVLAMQITKLMVLLFWDIHATYRLTSVYTNESTFECLQPSFQPSSMSKLILLALPLGFSAMLTSLTVNAPRFMIKKFMTNEMLGYFAAILALETAGQMVVEAAGLSALPRLSRYYQENRSLYIRLLLKLVILAAIMGLISVFVATLFGHTILEIMFTSKYAQFNNVFVWIMVYGTFAYIGNFLKYGMSSTQHFKAQPVIVGIALLVIIGTGLVIVPNHGLVGVVWCMIAGRIVSGIGAVIFIFSALQQVGNIKNHDSDVSFDNRCK
jgi:O-antigen/teichoic acid export membrane protein